MALVSGTQVVVVPADLQAGMNSEAQGWTGKRAFDVAGALVLILLLAPVMLLTALAVRLTSRGPVLFRQRRVGAGGREIPLLKFRTMQHGAEDRLAEDPDLRELYLTSGHKIPCDADPRLTPVGRPLRKWSLDELPQLFNVLAGHMSLVGPRPVTSEQLPEYGEYVGAYLAGKPGLTGLWQATGRNLIPFPDRAILDAHYRERCSLAFDLKIVARTPVAVALRRGAD